MLQYIDGNSVKLITSQNILDKHKLPSTDRGNYYCLRCGNKVFFNIEKENDTLICNCEHVDTDCFNKKINYTASFRIENHLESIGHEEYNQLSTLKNIVAIYQLFCNNYDFIDIDAFLILLRKAQEYNIFTSGTFNTYYLHDILSMFTSCDEYVEYLKKEGNINISKFIMTLEDGDGNLFENKWYSSLFVYSLNYNSNNLNMPISLRGRKVLETTNFIFNSETEYPELFLKTCDLFGFTKDIVDTSHFDDIEKMTSIYKDISDEMDDVIDYYENQDEKTEFSFDNNEKYQNEEVESSFNIDEKYEENKTNNFHYGTVTSHSHIYSGICIFLFGVLIGLFFNKRR